MTSEAPSDRVVLRRDREYRLIGGVCSGLARELGIDPLIIRVAFIAAALAGGVGIAVYILAWIFLPDGGAAPSTRPWRRLRTGRAAIEVALGAGLLLLAVMLAFRSVGLWFSDAIVWPLVLVTAGGALIWRQSMGGGTAPTVDAPAVPPEPTGKPGPVAIDPAPRLVPRGSEVSRTGLGIALVIAAGFAFLQATGSLSAARDVVVATLVVAIVLAVILAPWILRLVRNLGAERAERIRSQERAEMAAHLHDSVLQTLALMQKNSDDPRTVATLARRQERELRAWLSGNPSSVGGERILRAALERAAADIEEDHGVPVEVIVVGELRLDEAGEAVVAAAREAMNNAAKFGGEGPVNVYAEVTDAQLQVFVSDRGPGFAVGDVPADRRGVRESIIGRMERHGGQAEIRSRPGAGTEVELTLPLGEARS
jgi:phage shock protein PspC (stress-responsive transcriptional regulator)